MHSSTNLVGLAGNLARAVCDSDPGVALGALAELRIVLVDVENDLVSTARDRGWTWAEIARWSGLRTRQAAQARAARRVSVRPDL